MGAEDNPRLPLTELSLNDVQTILPPAFVGQLDRLFMCGNYGDPIAARDTLAVSEYLKEANPAIKLGMNTNASARNEAWWARLGGIFGSQGVVRFSVDGLADTNPLYRQGTDFDRIMKNAAAFIGAGGRAVWDYIVFRHNEHQVEEAREIATRMGFEQFQVKKTGRFFSTSKAAGKDHQDVMRRDGTVSHVLEKPLDLKYQNEALANEQALIARYGSLPAYFDQTPIRCKTGAEKSVYVSAEGLVFPCCWTANQLYGWYWKDERQAPIWRLIEAAGDKMAIDAKLRPISEIIEGPLFQGIQDSWSKPTCAAGKLQVCAKTCGTAFDPFKAQFKGDEE